MGNIIIEAMDMCCAGNDCSWQVAEAFISKGDRLLLERDWREHALLLAAGSATETE